MQGSLVVKVCCFFLLSSFFSPTLSAQTRSKYPASIEEILALPEHEIDLGIACLVLAKDAYPKLKIEVFDKGIDFIARRIEYLNKGTTDPVARIGLLNTYFFRPGWWNDSVTFTYDLDDLEAAKTENQFLNGILATKKGSCVTMAMLYLVVADRLGWPIKPVRSARHFFCRYIEEGFTENNIEATCGGGYLSDQDYIDQVNIPEKAVKNGVYLRTLTKKEYIASILQNNVRYFEEKKRDLDKALYYCKLSASLDSTFSGAYWNLGQLIFDKATELDSLRYEKILALKARFYYQPQSPQPQFSARATYPPRYKTLPAPSSLTMNERIESMKPKPLIFQKQQKPSPQVFDQKREIDNAIGESILQAEIQSINDEYGSIIKELIAESKHWKNKAKELGIVLKFPEEFFLKQAKAIEEFKRTGKY